MAKLTMEQIAEIEHFGAATINGNKYTYKDYAYKSEIYRNGGLIARIDNSKPVDDESRIEYVPMEWIPVTERLPETRPFPAWDQYLVCSEPYGNMNIVSWADGWNCSMDSKGVIHKNCEITDVVAWMPLPLPYEAEKDGE